MQRETHEKLDTKLDDLKDKIDTKSKDLEDKLDTNAKAQENTIAELQNCVEQCNT